MNNNKTVKISISYEAKEQLTEVLNLLQPLVDKYKIYAVKMPKQVDANGRKQIYITV